MLDERRLRTFAMVAETGSLAQAAERLAFTPPAVSQQIAALERDLGCVLLVRSSRGVSLTAEGSALLPLAHDVIDRLAIAESTARRLRHTKFGPMRLAAFASAGWRLLPRAFDTLRKRYPDMLLGLTEAEPPRALELLKAGEVDLAVTFTYDGVPPIEEPALEARLLIVDSLLVVVPEQHLLAGSKTVRLAQLAGEEWVIGLPDAVCTRATLHACHGAGFDPHVTLQTGDFITACGMVAAGLGVALVPTLAIPVPLPGVRYLAVENGAVARLIWAMARPHGTGSGPTLLAETIDLLAAAARDAVQVDPEAHKPG